MENVWVDGIPRQERRWGESGMERCCDDRRQLMGGNRMEEGTENDLETVETGGEGGARISVKY